jgi:hypothetical protein
MKVDARWQLFLLFATAAMLVALPACNGGESENETTTGPTAGVVVVTMTDDSCEYDGPMAVSDGHLTVEFVKEPNTDGALHLLRLADGITFDALEAHIEKEEERLERGLRTVGYQAFASLEASAELIGSENQSILEPLPSDLEPGDHAFLCIRTPALGLAGPLEVIP